MRHHCDHYAWPNLRNSHNKRNQMSWLDPAHTLLAHFCHLPLNRETLSCSPVGPSNLQLAPCTRLDFWGRIAASLGGQRLSWKPLQCLCHLGIPPCQSGLCWEPLVAWTPPPPQMPAESCHDRFQNKLINHLSNNTMQEENILEKRERERGWRKGKKIKIQWNHLLLLS